MRTLGYAIAVVLLVTAPSLAGSADHGLPGVGTFSYNGSAVVAPAPSVMAAVEIGH